MPKPCSGGFNVAFLYHRITMRQWVLETQQTIKLNTMIYYSNYLLKLVGNTYIIPGYNLLCNFKENVFS